MPFHAWCVVKGHDAVREAELAAQVIESGARSLFLDLEAHKGFWDGSSIDALVYGSELRRRVPDAFISTSIDPRPWQIDLVPIEEFAAFSDELAPQVYWSVFGSVGHLALYAREGLAPANGVIDGAFIEGSRTVGAESVSTFRFGTSSPSVFALLRNTEPRPDAYTVAAGDTLSALAGRWSTSVSALATLNGVEDPNLIVVGQQLIVPGRGRAGRTGLGSSSTSGVSALPGPSRAAGSPLASPEPTPSNGGTYTVQPGDSLSSIAQRFGVSLQALVEANAIPDANIIYVGQQLIVP